MSSRIRIEVTMKKNSIINFLHCQFRETLQRRHTSKNDSLLVSLLKQEAVVEKRETHSNQNSIGTLKKDPILDQTATTDVKIEQNFDGFSTKKQKGTKKSVTKTSVKEIVVVFSFLQFHFEFRLLFSLKRRF